MNRSPRMQGLRKLLVVAAALVFATMLSTLVFAQSGKGAISGRVLDASGAVLQGAQVDLGKSASTVASNAQGEFIFAGLPAGAYTLTVNYLGFETFSKEVSLPAGQVARVDAVLRVSANGEQITVYGGRESGEVEAINRMRTSDNILQVLPVEVVTSLPNTNIADALGRLPSVTLERDEGEGKYVQIRGTEPRYSNVTIDGINVPSPESGARQIKLDVVPANLVDSVEINKTLSANQDGDAIGGSVNLVTKTAGEKPTLYLNGMSGYTPILGGRPLYEIDGTTGKRFGATRKLGVLIGGSYDWNGRGIDDLEPAVQASQCDSAGCDGPQQAAGNAPYYPTYQTLDTREYRYYRTRYGLAGSVDYKLSDISGLFARFLYSHFDNFGDRWVYSPQIGSFTGAPANLGNADGSMSFSSQIRRPVQAIASLDLGGKHIWPKWVLAYDASIARSATEDKGYSQANFGGPAGIAFAVDRSNPHTPKLIPQGGVNIYDPTTYYLGNGYIANGYSPQLNLQGAFSASRSYNWGGHFGSFEFGAKIRNAHKFQDSRELDYTLQESTNPNDPALQMSNFVGSFTNSSYYDHQYTLGPTVDYRKVRSFLNTSYSNFFTTDVNATAQNTYPNNYNLVERVSAGYLMNTINVGRFRLQTGVRFEATNEDLLGYQILFDSNGDFIPGSVTAIRRSHSYLDPLPSVQVRYDLGHDAALRASYGRGIARPNFGDLPPTFNADASAQAVSVGNPNLKPTYANNFDLLFEKYLRPLGLLQAGFFYKQISDPIVGIKTTITDPSLYGAQYVGYELDQMVNGSGANLYGFEISYQQQLRFLPGLMSGLGFSGNYSYTNSHVNPSFRSDTPALVRQAPNTWNISPTYDRGRLSMRVGISHNDANIFQYNYSPGAPLGIKGPNGDVYLYSHTQLDAQGAIRMHKGLQFIVSGLNLTNEVFGFYQGSPQYPIQREFYKPTYSFGLRYTLSNDSK
jgi:TonB-dependent receptor